MKLRVLLISALALLASAAQAQFSGVTIRPVSPGNWDTVLVIVNPYETCPRSFGNPDSAKSLATSSTLRFHGGVQLKSGSAFMNWQKVKSAGPAETEFTRDAITGVFTKVIVPATYFAGITATDTITGLCFVVNGGPTEATMWSNEGKVCDGNAAAAGGAGDHIVNFDSIDSLYTTGPTSVKPSLAKLISGTKPNPFTGSTTVSFIGSNEMTSVKVYNTIGAEVATLVNGVVAGNQSITWNGTTTSGANAGAGMYIIRVQTGNRVDSRSVIKLD